MKPSPQLISIARAAREADVSELVIKRLIESGNLLPVKLPTGRFLIPRSQLNQLLFGNSGSAPAHA